MGLWAFASPLRDSRIAFATAFTASGCLTMFLVRIFSILSKFSFSEDMSLETGMLVHQPTISAIASGVTTSAAEPVEASSAAFFASSCSIRAWTSGTA